MRKIMIILFVIAIVASTVEAADARGPRHHDTTTEDMMMVAAKQVAGDDAQKAYDVYKQMKKLQQEELSRNAHDEAITAMGLFLWSALLLLVVYVFLRRLFIERRISWLSLIAFLMLVSSAIWTFFPRLLS